MGKKIKLSAQCFGIEFIRGFQCLVKVADLKERIVVHPVGYVIFIKPALHHFAPVAVDLDQKGKPAHKQTTVHQGSLVRQISDLKTEYEELYLNILEKLEDFNKTLMNSAL